MIVKQNPFEKIEKRRRKRNCWCMLGCKRRRNGENSGERKKERREKSKEEGKGKTKKIKEERRKRAYFVWKEKMFPIGSFP